MLRAFLKNASYNMYLECHIALRNGGKKNAIARNFCILLLSIFSLCFADEHKTVADELAPSDSLLLKQGLQAKLGVEKTLQLKKAAADTSSPSEAWMVRNGMSIPNYMLIAKDEIERRGGRVLWMKKKSWKSAIIKYEGIQGIYPVAEVRINDTLWTENSSNLAVIFFVKDEENKILLNKPELLKKLNFEYTLLIPIMKENLLIASKSLNTNVYPWVYMNNKWIQRGEEEKSLSKKLEKWLGAFKNATGTEVNCIAGFEGMDFLSHQASTERFVNALKEKNLWFLYLMDRGTRETPLAMSVCNQKEYKKCRQATYEKESEKKVTEALNNAAKSGSAILLLTLNENSVKLVENLLELASRQGTNITKFPL